MGTLRVARVSHVRSEMNRVALTFTAGVACLACNGVLGNEDAILRPQGATDGGAEPSVSTGATSDPSTGAEGGLTADTSTGSEPGDAGSAIAADAGPNETRDAGSSKTCTASQTLCGGQCTDVTSDPLHCGECTTVCNAPPLCKDGRCKHGG